MQAYTGRDGWPLFPTMMPEADRNTMAALESRLKAVNKAIGNSGDAAQARTTREEKRKELQKRNAEKREEKAMIIKQSWDLFFKVSGMGNNGTMGGMGSNGGMGAMGSMDGNGGMGAMGSMDGNGGMGAMGGMRAMGGMGSIDMKKLGEYIFAQAKAGAQAGMEEQQKKAPLALGNGGVQDSLTAVRKEVQKLNQVKDTAVMHMVNAEYDMVLEAAVQYVTEKQPRHVMRCAVQRMLDENREEVKEHAAKRARLGDKEKELESEEDEDDESEEESSEEEEE